MRPASFRHHPARSVDEALTLLASEDEDARILAGGQSLVPLMNLRMAQPSALIDINGCDDLGRIDEAGGWIEFGARVRQREGELSTAVRARLPMVAAALELNGHPATRHRGTICGTLAHADPSAELPAVAVALGAEMVLRRQGACRIVPAEAFFLGALETCIEPGEMLAAVRFPVQPARAGWGLAETGLRRHDLALAGIAVAMLPAGVTRICAFGITPEPLRLPTLEAAADDLPRAGGTPATQARIAEALAADLEGADLVDTLHASARYRQQVTATLAARALADARQRASQETAT